MHCYIAFLGPQVDAFEKEFCEKVGISYAIALNSDTAALHLALRHLGVGSGDEVIAPSLTFIGGVSPVLFLGANLSFIDSERTSLNMDSDLLQEGPEIRHDLHIEKKSHMTTGLPHGNRSHTYREQGLILLKNARRR